MKSFGAVEVCRVFSSIKALNRPVLLKDFASEWPAVSAGSPERYWRNFRALKNRLEKYHGEDSDIVVPVEFNGSYMDSNMQQGHVSFYSILDTLVEEEKHYTEVSSGGQEVRQDMFTQWYLAQYELQQVSPVLLDDLEIPHALMEHLKNCETSNDARDPTLYRNNVWLGGHRGTNSPTHQDPFHNIFVQIFGEKSVHLFAPAEVANLHPAPGTQKNTSLVRDILREDGGDLSEYPHYANAKGEKCILKPGDCLFIPRKWWHHCSTDSASCGVNWWWL
eukprot:GSChrysophyteH1.ASY1.ANO1.194.1 assembled CDS